MPLRSLLLFAAITGICSFSNAQAPCDFPASLPLRVLLEGPCDSLTGLMEDDLRANGLIPLTEPYTALGYTQVGGGGGETIVASVLEVTGNDAIVDWVIVEIRHANDPGKRILSRCALIQRDGDIVDLNGTSEVGICATAGSYMISVRHRNHLGIMSSSPIEFMSGQFGSVFVNPVDLSSPNTPVWRDGQARKRMGTHMAMWNGDVTFDGQVKYTGSGNDRDPLLIEVGSTTPNNVDSGYVQSDVNLDAVTKYTGSGNDRDGLLRTVGSTTPNGVRAGYIPTDSLTIRPNVHVMDNLPVVLDTNRSDLDSNTIMVFAISGVIPAIDVDHIVVGGDPRGGYLRRVTSATLVNDSLTLVTVQASLSEVFASGTLNLAFNSEQASPSARAFYYVEPIPLINSNQATVRVEDISFNYSGNSLCDVTFGPGGVLAGEFATRGINIGLNYKLKFQGNLYNDSASWLGLKNTILKDLKIIYGIPIYYELKLSAKLKGKVEFYGAVQTSTDVGVSLQADVGVTYDQETGFHDINSFSLPSPQLSTEIDNVGIGFKGSLEWMPEVQLELYKVGGPYFSSGPSASADLRVTASPAGVTHDIKAEVKWKTKAGVKMKILDYEPDYAFVYESAPFVSFTSPDRMDTNQVEGNLQIAIPGDTLKLPLKVHIESKLKVPGAPHTYFDSKVVPVDFEVIAGSGHVSAERDYTDLDGMAQTYWTLGPEPVTQQRLRAWVRNGVGDTIPFFFDFQADSAVLTLEYVSGDEQIGEPDSTLTDSLVVRVLDQNDEVVPDVSVSFAVIDGNGDVSDFFLPTDSMGLAKVAFTLGNDSTERNSVLAFLLNNQGDTLPDGTYLFRAYINPDTMMYAQLSGNFQTGNAGTVLPVDLRVEVRSVLGQEVQEDVLVYFEVVSGGGSVSSFGTSTNSDGIASVAWTLGPDLTIRQKVKAWSLDVYGDTLRGGPLYFEACTIICPATVTDIDGNIYPVVKAGCDCWFQDNLKTGHFANGDAIASMGNNTLYYELHAPYNNINNSVTWPLLHPAWDAPAYSEDTEQEHDGFVYNFRAMGDTREICPLGWHKMSSLDLMRLASQLGIDIYQMVPNALVLPSAWPPTSGANNLTGLSIRPGRYIAGVGIDLNDNSAIGNHWRFHWAPGPVPFLAPGGFCDECAGTSYYLEDYYPMEFTKSPFEDFIRLTGAPFSPPEFGPSPFGSYYTYCRCVKN